jgi:hypothetical protein
MRKRQTLETAIREILSDFPASARFRVKAFTLQREGCPGEGWHWCADDAFWIESNADLETVLSAARGRWEVFKANYVPRARVADLTDIGYDTLECGVNLECGQVPFIEIIPVKD